MESEVIELKNTWRERLQVPVLIALLFLVFDLVDYFYSDKTFKTPSYIVTKTLILVVVTVVWFCLPYAKIDKTGITIRQWFFTKRLEWNQIANYDTRYKSKFEGIASSYGCMTTAYEFTFRDNTGKEILVAKINFGPVSDRIRAMQFIQRAVKNQN